MPPEMRPKSFGTSEKRALDLTLSQTGTVYNDGSNAMFNYTIWTFARPIKSRKSSKHVHLTTENFHFKGSFNETVEFNTVLLLKCVNWNSKMLDIVQFLVMVLNLISRNKINIYFTNSISVLMKRTLQRHNEFFLSKGNILIFYGQNFFILKSVSVEYCHT